MALCGVGECMQQDYGWCIDSWYKDRVVMYSDGKPSLSVCRAVICMDVHEQPAPPVGHLLDVTLAARTHAAR